MTTTHPQITATLDRLDSRTATGRSTGGRRSTGGEMATADKLIATYGRMFERWDEDFTRKLRGRLAWERDNPHPRPWSDSSYLGQLERNCHYAEGECSCLFHEAIRRYREQQKADQ